MTPEGPRRRAGRAGEARAAAFLAARGYQLRDRNWHCRYGEWDLILAAPQGRLWLCRGTLPTPTPRGYTAATVTPRSKPLTLAAQLYLAASATQERREPPPCRVDVIALTGPSPAEAHLEWIRNAFGEVS